MAATSRQTSDLRNKLALLFFLMCSIAFLFVIAILTQYTIFYNTLFSIQMQVILSYKQEKQAVDSVQNPPLGKVGSILLRRSY
jgi:hypothetical protein